MKSFSILNRSSPSCTFGNGHQAKGAAGTFENCLDILPSKSRPHDAIALLEAYLFGVCTCVVLFVAYKFFLRPSVTFHRRRRRKGNSPSKRKHRKLFVSGAAFRMNSDKASNDHILPPPSRIAYKPLSNNKAYRRLSSRIYERVSTRAFLKSERMTKKRSGSVIDYDLERSSVGRGADRRRHEDYAKANCHDVDHRPTGRNWARYNQKKATRYSERSQPKIQNMASSLAYNNGKKFGTSSQSVMGSGSTSSYELFRHMNSQPLHKDVQKSLANICRDRTTKMPLSITDSGNHRKSQDGHVYRTADLMPGKENINKQLVGSSSVAGTTPRIKSRHNIAKKPLNDSKTKRDPSHEPTLSAKGNAQNEIQIHEIRKNKRDSALSCKESPKNQRCHLGQQKKQTHKRSLNMEEPNHFGLAVRMDQALPGSKTIPAQSVDMGEKPALVTPEARLTVLISKGVYDYNQKANQKAALSLLDDLCIPYKIVDGMDPLQRENRNDFFEISGVRGNYPQIFSGSEFLGGYDWLHKMKIEDLNKFSRK